MQAVVHQPTQTSVLVWLQADQFETGWHVTLSGPPAEAAQAWAPDGNRPHPLPNMLVGSPDTQVWIWAVENLQAGTDYTVSFVESSGRETEAATFRTLPKDLTTPFTVLIGSCYSEDSDAAGSSPEDEHQDTIDPFREFVQAAWQRLRHGAVAVRSYVQTGPVSTEPKGNVSRRYQRLYESSDRRPDIKILAGDQVYLDSPWYHFVGIPMHQSAIKRHVSRTYARTWEKLGWLLSHGANFCVSDDHEFWNDYPNIPSRLTIWPSFLVDRFRRAWKLQARDFLRWVQLPRPTTRFDIGGGGGDGGDISGDIDGERPEISFFIADTRMHRTDVDAGIATDPEHPLGPRFMNDIDFDAMLTWIAELRAPAVLVLGQPILTRPTSTRVRGLVVTDRSLAAYQRQYNRLCEALISAPHDIVILTGDVHFGRVTEVEVPRIGRAPLRIVEIISSPMAAVRHGGTRFTFDRSQLSGRFPFPWSPDFNQRVPGVVEQPPILRKLALVPAASGQRCPDHYMTVRFSRGDAPGEIAVKVTAYALTSPSDELADSVLLEHEFVLGSAGARSLATRRAPSA